jgi:hypothetical protein
MSFKLWSEISKEAKDILSPDLGLRFWDQLSHEDKNVIWKHLEVYFFLKTPIHDPYSNSKYRNEKGMLFQFYTPDSEYKRNRIDFSVASINYIHKAKNYGSNYLENPIHYSACLDFYEIFMMKEGHAVIELLSLYSKALIEEKKSFFSEPENGTEEEYKQTDNEHRWYDFDEFSKELNEVFKSFGLNVYLTRSGFMPKQEDKIIREIYEPVLSVLSHPDWRDVNMLLTDAFIEFRKRTPNGYSTSVTHSVASVQAFLQILVYKKIGTGEISKLIDQAQRQNLIPSDMFTKVIFKNIEAVLMRERQETGDPHPKQAYATEKNALMVLNLAMVFFQHCIVH